MGYVKIVLLIAFIVLLLVFSLIDNELTNRFSPFILGLISAGVGSEIFDRFSKNRERNAEFIKSQIQNLYGPLKIFLGWNTAMLKHYNKIHEVYSAEAENLTNQEMIQTLETANQYVKKVRENDQHILEILENYYYLLEDSDFEMVTNFLLNYTRNKTEFDAKLTIPIEIYQSLDNISVLNPEFVTLVNKRFMQKRSEWKNLTKS